MTTPTHDELLKLATEADCMHVNLYGDRTMGMERLARFAALLSAHQAQAEPIKNHDIARTVNNLRDIAIRFHGANQLRDLISSEIALLLSGVQPSTAGSECQRCKGSGDQEYLVGGGPDARDEIGPCSGCGGTGAVAQPSADQTWNEAIEAAASARPVNREFDYESYLDSGNSGDIAKAVSEQEGAAWQDAIRKLARPSQAQEPITPTCKCGLRASLVGDGCAVCNPELAAEMAQPASGAVEWAPGPNEFKNWCTQWFGPDADDDYLAKAVHDIPPMAQRFRRPTLCRAQQAPAVSDSELLIRATAKNFYNKTVGDPAVRISTSVEAKRDEVIKAGELLRAALLSEPDAAAAPVSEQTEEPK